MSNQQFTVGQSVVIRGYEQRTGFPVGIVRMVTPRRAWVWTGATGFGQREWAFDHRGCPVGETARAFPGIRIEAQP